MNKQIEPDNNVLDVLTSDETTLLQQLEGVVEEKKDQAKEAIRELAYALREIQQKRLYRAWRGTPEKPLILAPGQKEATFEQYVEGRFPWKRATVYHLIDWANITDLMLPEGYTPSRAEARVLEALKPEQIKTVARFAESATGKTKLTGSDIKSVADVVVQIDAVGVVEDPETGEHVEFSTLTPEQQAAIIRENVTTATHERMERKKLHIEEKQQQQEEEKANLSTLNAKNWQEWHETFVLNNPHMVIIHETRSVEGRPQHQFKAMNDETKQVLQWGDPKPWMKAAAMSLIEVLK